MDQMGVTQEQIDSDNTNIVPDRADPPGVTEHDAVLVGARGLGRR